MFKIDHLDFYGTKGFDELLDKMFPNLEKTRYFNEDGTSGVRVYVPRKDCGGMARNANPKSEPSWRKEVRSWEDVEKPVDFPKDEERPSDDVREPKSILEMLEDGDKRLEELLGRIVDKKLDERKIVRTNNPVEDEYDDDEDDYDGDSDMEKKDPFVFIANRLTFLIQTMFPIVFDTSTIDTGANSMTIALNGTKTYPKLGTIDDLGFITSEINRSSTIQKEIEEYLDGTGFSNIYCFPFAIMGKHHDEVLMAVKFVLYLKREHVNF